jgi:hypothetical protein
MARAHAHSSTVLWDALNGGHGPRDRGGWVVCRHERQPREAALATGGQLQRHHALVLCTRPHMPRVSVVRPVVRRPRRRGRSHRAGFERTWGAEAVTLAGSGGWNGAVSHAGVREKGAETECATSAKRAAVSKLMPANSTRRLAVRTSSTPRSGRTRPCRGATIGCVNERLWVFLTTSWTDERAGVGTRYVCKTGLISLELSCVYTIQICAWRRRQLSNASAMSLMLKLRGSPPMAAEVADSSRAGTPASRSAEKMARASCPSGTTV